MAILSEELDSRRSRTVETWVWLLGAFSVLLGLAFLTLIFVIHRGAHLSGDGTSYVGEAFALGRLHTWDIGSAFASSDFDHLIRHSTPIEQFVRSHGFQFPYHAIGFSALLAPAIALRDTLGAVHLELLALTTALVVWLSVEVTTLTRAPRKMFFLVVVLFVAPGYLIAASQVYPDLLSGLLLAVAIVRIMNVEYNGPSGISSSAVTGALLFTFVWLDDKNIVIGILVGTIAALVAHRRRATGRELAILIGIVALGVIGVTSLDIYMYGHPLGPLQDIAPFSGKGLTKLAALILDRRHGILVQSPATLLGLVGIMRWWRRAPLSVSVGVASAVLLLVGNAGLVTGMEGGSFLGRYEWEVLPLALAFGGLFLIELASLRRRATATIVGVLAFLALTESWAVWTSRSDGMSFYANVWDPATYLGWWGRLDPSPVLNYMNGEWSNSRNLWGLGALVALALAVVLVLRRLGGTRKKKLANASVAAFLAAILCWGLALTSPFLLPAPMNYAASQLGTQPLPRPSQSITVDGPGHEGAILSGPNLSVLPGEYRVTIFYRLDDPSTDTATFTVREQGQSNRRSKSIYRRLHSSMSTTQQSLDLHVTSSGRLSLNLNWRGTGRLTVKSVTIAKIATCRVVECDGSFL